MRCDADDLFPQGRIRQQALWLSEHPEYDAVSGSLTIDSSESAELDTELSAFNLLQCIDHIHAHSCADAAHVLAMVHRMGGPPYNLTLHGDLDRKPQKVIFPIGQG